MRDDQEHVLVPTLKRQLVEGAIDRREFLRYATLLGVAAGDGLRLRREGDGREAGGSGGGPGRAAEGRHAAHRHALPGPQEPAHVQLGRVVELGPPGPRLPHRHRRRQRHAARTRREVGGEPRPQDVDPAPAPQRQVAQRPPVHGRRRRLEPEARARSQDGLVRARPHEGLSPRGLRDRREGRQGQPEEVVATLGCERDPEGRRLHRPPERQVRAARRARAALPLPAAHHGSGRERRVQGRQQRHRRLPARRQRGREEAGAQGAQGGLLGRRALSRPARVHRPRRRPGGGRGRARVEAGGRALRRRHRPARGAPEDPAREDVPGHDGLHGDGEDAAGEAVRRQARPAGDALRDRLERRPAGRPSRVSARRASIIT